MSRRIDIELTSTRDDGSWTWRAAGAREPKGTLEAAILPDGAAVGQVHRAEIEGHLDGISVVAILPPKAARSEPERLELKSSAGDQPLVTSTLAPKRSGERGRRNDRGRDRDRDRPGGGGRERRGDRDRDRDRRPRQDGRHERSARPAPPPVEEKPKPKRLRPGKVHRTALLEAVPAEQRPIAEQLLAGGIPAVRQAIEKQNEELKAAGKTEVKPDALLRVAEELRGKAAAAVWRDRADAAVAVVDELDLRDLRSVVNASGDAGRDDEAKALAAQLREALANRVEKEHAAWLAELAETVQGGRVVRALRLSSRPPKAGAPIPGDIATQLAEATAASLTSDTGPDRWATVLDALAYSPVRRRVIPQSLPEKLNPDLRATIARLASRLPEIAHIFDIEADPAAERAARNANRRGGRKGDDRAKGGKSGKGRGDRGRGGKSERGPKGTDAKASATEATDAKATDATPADAKPVDAKPAEAATTEASTSEDAPKSADETPKSAGDTVATEVATADEATTTEPATTDDATTEAANPEAADTEAATAADEATTTEPAPTDDASTEGTPSATEGASSEAVSNAPDGAVTNGSGHAAPAPATDAAPAEAAPTEPTLEAVGDESTDAPAADTPADDSVSTS